MFIFPDEAFMSIELRKNALEEVSGIVEYISVFLK